MVPQHTGIKQILICLPCLERWVHSLWWVKDAPDIKTVEGRRKAPGFIDKYISCHLPKYGEDDDLKDLVLRLKKHNHTQTCRKMDVIALDLITPRGQVIQLVLREMLMLEIKPV